MPRVRIAIAVVVVAALLPAAGVFMQMATQPGTLRWRDDRISLFERHVAPLREAVRGERAVGYLAPTQVDRAAHLYTLRYALAPVLVVDDLGQPLVVADGVTDPQRLPPQLRVRRDFGDGLLLLEQAPK